MKNGLSMLVLLVSMATVVGVGAETTAQKQPWQTVSRETAKTSVNESSSLALLGLGLLGLGLVSRRRK